MADVMYHQIVYGAFSSSDLGIKRLGVRISPLTFTPNDWPTDKNYDSWPMALLVWMS